MRPLIERRSGSAAGPNYRVAEWAQRNVPNYMVRTNEWKLMTADSPDSHAVDALFDMKNDPDDMHNLLGDPADRTKYAGRADEMKQRLPAWLERLGSPQVAGVQARKLG